MKPALVLALFLLAACATERPRPHGAPLTSVSGLEHVSIIARGME